MHYLKCNRCGFLNELKTEYQVLCKSCGKKMDNNFPNWHQLNPEKDFNDYLQMNGITEEKLMEKPIKQPKSSRKWIYWIGFILIFGSFYAIGHYTGINVSNLLNKQNTPEAVLHQEWIHGTYGDPAINVETPEKLVKGELPLPDNLKPLIQRLDSYHAALKTSFNVSINCITYKPEIGVVSLKGAADGSINEFRSKSGVSDLSYTEKVVKLGQIPGFIQHVKCKMDGKDYEFINVGYSAGLSLWQVIVGFLSEDEIGRAAAQKVVESIQIKK